MEVSTIYSRDKTLRLVQYIFMFIRGGNTQEEFLTTKQNK